MVYDSIFITFFDVKALIRCYIIQIKNVWYDIFHVNLQGLFDTNICFKLLFRLSPNCLFLRLRPESHESHSSSQKLSEAIRPSFVHINSASISEN